MMRPSGGMPDDSAAPTAPARTFARALDIASTILDIMSTMQDRRAAPLSRDINGRIARRVRALRAELGMTLDALAAKSEVSRSMISLVERGESSPTAAVLEKIASGLGVSQSHAQAGTVHRGDRHRAIACVEEMNVTDAIRIRCLQTIAEREIEGLSDVLIDCVEGGASVSFMLPMSRAKADAFWRSTAASVARGERVVLGAEDAAGTIVGTAQVILAQPENQPHRGDLAKMLVHRRARRRGVGAALLVAAERSALSAGKTLLVLDTASDDAERRYARQGWQRCGAIPNYALWPDGRPCTTTFFYKFLRE